MRWSLLGLHGVAGLLRVYVVPCECSRVHVSAVLTGPFMMFRIKVHRPESASGLEQPCSFHVVKGFFLSSASRVVSLPFRTLLTFIDWCLRAVCWGEVVFPEPG